MKLNDLYLDNATLHSYKEVYDDNSAKRQIIIVISLYDNYQADLANESKKKYEFIFCDIFKVQKTQRINNNNRKILNGYEISKGKYKKFFILYLRQGYIEIEYKKTNIKLLS